MKSFNYVNKDNSKVRKNKYGQRYVDRVNRIKSIKGRLQHLNRNEYDAVNDLYTIHGVEKPLWMIVDPEGVSATDAGLY